jgi:hypothetical protein
VNVVPLIDFFFVKDMDCETQAERNSDKGCQEKEINKEDVREEDTAGGGDQAREEPQGKERLWLLERGSPALNDTSNDMGAWEKTLQGTPTKEETGALGKEEVDVEVE